MARSKKTVAEAEYAIEIRQYETAGRESLAALQDFQIQSTEDLERCKEYLDEVVKTKKVLEARKKEITGPLNQALKKVRDLFRPAEEFVSQCEEYLRDAPKRYLLAQQAKQDAALAAVEAGPVDECTLVVAHDTAVLPKGLSARTVWTYRITDASLIPREFLCVDETKLRKYVQAMGADCAVPGVEVIRDISLTNRISA